MDLARAGCDVTIFEALHTAGGVLKYGIPEFRLPKALIDKELDDPGAPGRQGGDERHHRPALHHPPADGGDGLRAVFVGMGAGYPSFMGIPGEGYNGIFSANEYLTRVNLMAGYEHPGLRTRRWAWARTWR